MRFISNVILPYKKAIRAKNNTPDQEALVIFDVFKGHTGEAVQTRFEEKTVSLE